MKTQATAIKISVQYYNGCEEPEILEHCYTWHDLPNQSKMMEKARVLVDVFYRVVTG